MTTELAPAIREYFDALTALDREAYVAAFASDASVQDPYGGPVLEGEEGLNKFFDGMERTWQSFRMTPEKGYKSGNRVAVPWSTAAMARNGKRAEFEGVNVFELAEDGRIQRLEGYWDFKGMLAQIRE